MQDFDAVLFNLRKIGWKLFIHQCTQINSDHFATEIKTFDESVLACELALSYSGHPHYAACLTPQAFRALDPLREKIKHLRLHRAGIQDYAVLDSFDSLRTLEISLGDFDSNLVNCDFLSIMNRLRNLSIKECIPRLGTERPTISFSGMHCLINLKELTLHFPSESTIRSALRSQPLECFRLKYDPKCYTGRFIDYDLRCNSLKSLKLQSTKRDDGDWCLSIPGLERLELFGVHLFSYARIASCKFLREVFLHDQNVELYNFELHIKESESLVRFSTQFWRAWRTSPGTEWCIEHLSGEE